jgi:P-type Cu+ transporter
MGPGTDVDRDMAQVVEHDPVCGARITDEDAAPSVEYGGRKWWFCGDSCRSGFLADPERFALDEDLAEDVAAQRSDGEAGTLRDDEPYLSS